jgi:hypothetical protein
MGRLVTATLGNSIEQAPHGHGSVLIIFALLLAGLILAGLIFIFRRITIISKLW